MCVPIQLTKARTWISCIQILLLCGLAWNGFSKFQPRFQRNFLTWEVKWMLNGWIKIIWNCLNGPWSLHGDEARDKVHKSGKVEAWYLSKFIINSRMFLLIISKYLNELFNIFFVILPRTLHFFRLKKWTISGSFPAGEKKKCSECAWSTYSIGLLFIMLPYTTTSSQMTSGWELVKELTHRPRLFWNKSQ